jgi:DNA replication and repair protein RecF
MDSQMIRHGAEGFQLQGYYSMNDEMSAIISCITKSKGKKLIKRDRKEYQRFSDHIGYIPLVLISPLDYDLISGGSDERRRFMDMVISQYDKDYLNRLISYGKALQQRNILLKQESMPDDELFLMWEQKIADCGNIIYEKRRAFLDRLIPYFQSLYSDIGHASESVSLYYNSHVSRGSLLKQLREGRSLDRATGYTLHGVHKDELEMMLGEYPIKREGSQGQNKSYLTALKLAQYLMLVDVCEGKKPILLLDDIFDKLDALRVEKILKLVSDDRFGQIFITDVNRDHLNGILSGIGCDYKVFDIKDGTVQ